MDPANCRLIVFYNEVDVLELKGLRSAGRREKSTLEECTNEQSAKRICVGEEFKISGKSHRRKIRRARDDVNFWQKRLQTCARKKGQETQRSKSQQYTRRHQARVKKQLKEQCHTTLSFLGLYKYVAIKVEEFNEDTSKLVFYSS